MTCILLLLIPTSGREGPLPLSVILTSQSSAQQACTRAPSFCGEHPRLCKPSPFLCPSPFPAGLARYRSDNFQESWEVPKIIIFPVTVLPKAGPGADNPPRAGWWLRQLGALRCKPCTIYGHLEQHLPEISLQAPASCCPNVVTLEVAGGFSTRIPRRLLSLTNKSSQLGVPLSVGMPSSGTLSWAPEDTLYAGDWPHSFSMKCSLLKKKKKERIQEKFPRIQKCIRLCSLQKEKFPVPT